MKFEWDDNKEALNYVNHKISFKEAVTVFRSPRVLEFFDSRTTSEDRFIIIGFSQKLNLLVVVFCERDPKIIRIISARKVTLQERRIYEERI